MQKLSAECLSTVTLHLALVSTGIEWHTYVHGPYVGFRPSNVLSLRVLGNISVWGSSIHLRISEDKSPLSVRPPALPFPRAPLHNSI